jgi:hypothetical protein
MNEVRVGEAGSKGLRGKENVPESEVQDIDYARPVAHHQIPLFWRHVHLLLCSTSIAHTESRKTHEANNKMSSVHAGGKNANRKIEKRTTVLSERALYRSTNNPSGTTRNAPPRPLVSG